ncbi:MAG: NAD-dependent dihydropyrimidine dehydrogenase subunit PreA [Acidobacteria bacterium]|nr:MAG: NAD-dependent dihydropyrimidine dehydrogenase subunit PreA [Acidobacteriota bacterium]PYY19347.1 MAG: NAD-dependent dihydropyrimidine dehydrogenase subunit PreA [Acidobacteriota bacterium]
MPDLSINFCGVRSPNPFWLASGPPTNTAYQVMKAFDAGWGGAVWKTIGDPIINTASRYGSIDYKHERMIGLNNIELISDRPIETNFREISEVKKRFPKNTVVASLMVESKRETWHDIVRRAQDSGSDLLELNFGCPHGMSERGMGAAVGQVPEYTTMITTWVKEVATIPVIVKLTPNVTDVAHMASAAKQGGAGAVSLVNTFNSLVGVDLDTYAPRPNVGGYGSHGGYCGPSVKPIALHMVSSVAKHPTVGVPISGIGGIANWQDATEFILLGATSVQVCTAAMHYGFRIVEDMIDGLSQYLEDKGFNSVMDLVGKSVNRIRDWGDLDLNYKIVARIDPQLCIGCNLCYIACEDGAHQCIAAAERPRGDLRDGEIAKHVPRILEDECVGCNLCALVCPVPGCITMEQLDNGRATMSWRQLQEARGRNPQCTMGDLLAKGTAAD